jgi:hypothetical protein
LEKYIKPALIANAATLGIHWIYDPKYLKELEKKQDILFLIQHKEIYDNASLAFYSYPNHKVGDVTVQGEMLKWLYKAMKDNEAFTVNNYEDLLYSYFKPGGLYKGYVESYALKNIVNKISLSLNLDHKKEPLNDDHLVGFIPYLVCKELGLSLDKAWSLAQLFTENKDYFMFYEMFDVILDSMNQSNRQACIKEAIKKAPRQYLDALEKAIEMDDTDAFIEKYSGRACAINQSIPLIIHILYHIDTYEKAIRKNALIGGAISDRNTLLGAVYAQISNIPEAWENKVILP